MPKKSKPGRPFMTILNMHPADQRTWAACTALAVGGVVGVIYAAVTGSILLASVAVLWIVAAIVMPPGGLMAQFVIVRQLKKREASQDAKGGVGEEGDRG